jgi:cysteine-rich repeat protein
MKPFQRSPYLSLFSALAAGSCLVACGSSDPGDGSGACAAGQARASDGTCVPQQGNCKSGEVFVDGLCKQAGCGDGIITAPEQCEPPNVGSCNATCQIVTECGDGVTAGKEGCDPPDGVSCDANCQPIPPVSCGDGTSGDGEQCDDGGNSPFDGCDATCDFEPFFRIDELALSFAAAPAFCSLGANAFAKFAQGLPLVGTIPFQAADRDNLLDVRKLTDLTGASDEPVEVGLVYGFPDPTQGKMPAAPLDWPFIIDQDSVTAGGVPKWLLAPANIAGGVLETSPGKLELWVQYVGAAFTLELDQAQLGLGVGSASSRPPDPTPLAPGLVVMETLDGKAGGPGLCGALSVQSLAKMPIFEPAAGFCQGSSVQPTYKPCVGAVDASCNSMLDLLVGGCASSFGSPLSPLQPDVKQGGPLLVPDLVTHKVPESQLSGNADGYSAAFTLTATRQKPAGVGAKPPPLPCDPTAAPYDDPCVIDEQYAVFADPTADDAIADGSRAKPYGKLASAVPAAIAASKRLYLCGDFGSPGGGNTSQKLVVTGPTNGLEIYGRFTCKTWTPNGGTGIWSDGTEPALIVDGVDSLRVEDVIFVTQDYGAGNPGSNQIAAIINDSQNVYFKNANFLSGIGGDAPSVPASSVPASDGVAGSDGASECAANPNPGGGASVSNCDGSPASTGASGGIGGVGTGDGGNGASGAPPSTAGGGGLGENASGWSCVAGSGLGQDGAAGAIGSSGAGATGLGTIGIAGYQGASGQPGTPGLPGQGGGGGGGARAAIGALVCAALGVNVGASGGGGGGGGCGGKVGAGGLPGGSSITLISVNSKVVLEQVSIQRNPGGKGGNGAAGQAGGTGGPPGLGGTNNTTGTSGGCNGGKGGPGGVGGPGGGGSGGHSIGIAYTGQAPTLINPLPFLSINGKTPGLGGFGGDYSSINAGDNGISADMLAFDQPYVPTPVSCPPPPPTSQCSGGAYPAEATGACTFVLTPQARLDPSKINVGVADQFGAPIAQGGLVCAASSCAGTTNGWYFDDYTKPKSVTLCADLCSLLDASHGAVLQTGCPTIGAP